MCAEQKCKNIKLISDEGSDTVILIHPTKADIGSKILDAETLEDGSEDAAITIGVAEY